ncbi:glycoside hydrolase/phage tail family protein [uncultured Alsobacter sp.]|uniref:baseplate multidomain protein megatron n=1 Tax=uncultured Alsobacter sp. TaxID=1748258 RepID=UPI0025D15D3A|nr:glycoside hydrolase/phage tail family protein [uncultured Alsobacter sp.]
MSTLVLQAAGAVAGGAIGGPVGSAVGRALGGLAGAALDGGLRHSSHTVASRSVEGPRLTSLPALGSSEGAPIPRVFGRARIGGEIIWATRYEEVVSVSQSTSTSATRTSSSGGKGSRTAASATSVTTTTRYSYFANFAVGLCEGPIAFVRRVWADGKLLDTRTLAMRVHRGTQDQEPDPLIVAKEGAAAAPAYRGTAYVVFERLALEPFGNRVPQLTFEVVRPVHGFADRIRAVNLIPGAGEFVLDPQPVSRVGDLGATVAENTHQWQAASDWGASLDALQALCPNLRRVSLVVAWFGDDLRAGSCTVAPRIEDAGRSHVGTAWSVAGLDRGHARVVSRADGVPAFGGTPSDASVVRAIRDLKARGLEVTLNPFLMMDVPAGSGHQDPWSGAADQPAYPWRGRITCDPAPGRPNSAEGTASAQAQIDRFFGQALASHMVLAGDAVSYAGPDTWSLSRQVLHCAALGVAAGGVDAVLIGSELVGLTRVRDAAGRYPAVDRLVALAGEVRRLVGPATAVTYAADWTEYGGHWPAPGTLRFPLDTLWSAPAVTAVAIDAWWPMADWRDGPLHADASRFRGPHDPDGLLAGTAGGEGYDWYYASDSDRRLQRRSPITDGLGKPWINRPKDLQGWWASPHVERDGGIETRSTAWVPQGKPIWLMEVGCPAVDKGANAPNAFPDPRSTAATLPPFSTGARDDLMLARGVIAVLTRFDPAAAGHPAGSNPVSPVYGGRMVDPDRIHVWAWDARPFPAFPSLASVWADGASWQTGHWLNGRLEAAPLDLLVADVLAATAVAPVGRVAVDGWCHGFVLDRPLSARAALQPLAEAFGFEAVASSGELRFLADGSRRSVAIAPDDLVPGRDGSLVQRVRAQEADLVDELTVGFIDAEGDYASAAATARRAGGASVRTAQVDLPAVLDRAVAETIAERALHRAWIARETATLVLRPGLLELEPGDTVMLPAPGAPGPYRIVRIRDAGQREIEARAVPPPPASPPPRARPRPGTAAAPSVAGRPLIVTLDWPLARTDPAVLQSFAAAADPWTGPLAVWRSVDGASYALAGSIAAASLIGRTMAPLPAGPPWRWDRTAVCDVVLSGDGLVGRGDLAALAGEAVAAVRGADGQWEVLAFAAADLVGPRRFRLSRLLRGLGGSERAAARPAPAGSDVVILDGSLFDAAVGADALGRALRWRIGPATADVGDPAMVSLTATPGADALRPLAPVRAGARRTADGVALAWIRRSRLGGDAWEPVDTPLDEASERYEVDVLKAGLVVRTLGATSPAVLYPAAAELADFGAPQPTLSVRIVQLSASVGRGAPLEAVLAAA